MNLLRLFYLLEAMALLVGLIFVVISYVSYRRNGKTRGYYIYKFIGLALLIGSNIFVLVTNYYKK